MRIRKGRAQAARVGRHQNQMDVVGHQAIAPHLDTSRPTALRDQRAIFGKIVRTEEHGLPPIAALRYVMRNPR
jgi:hypothetical protein